MNQTNEGFSLFLSNRLSESTKASFGIVTQIKHKTNLRYIKPLKKITHWI